MLQLKIFFTGEDFMFFIIGVTPKIKSIGTGNGDCPACGKSVNFHLRKKSSVLTLFFIPLIPFGGAYRATCSNCDSIMSLSKERGKDFENGNKIIHDSDLKILQNNVGAVCKSCGAKIIVNQNFCYHCGDKF